MTSPSPARYLVGIDLGTVNSALAYVDLASEGDLAGAIQVFPVPQLVAAGETAELRLLPSSAYLPAEGELPAGATRLPWGDEAVVVGAFARSQGARVPGRLVSSAKSWLSHARVDRTAPILPWGAPEGVPRLSPVAASARYLGHLRAAWDARFPGAPLAAQEVSLTVPASFDEVARELTLRAAREAGLPRVRLLEEPQAAFHDFTARSRASLEQALAGSRVILVCDVGGGTTDFTLIHAAVRDGVPALTRLAVGDHLLLGGDNVDLALARAAEQRLGARLDAVQWGLLVQACREAKEKLLAPGAPERTRVSVVSRGARLLGSALSAELSREEVRALLLDGFFPRVGRDERPRSQPRGAALQELGLPYQADPAVTRHAAAFLAEHAAEVEEALGAPQHGLARPDALLLNGGVFTPPEVGARLAEVISSWFPGAPPVALLPVAGLDVAVARGAAYGALVRRGHGLRIGGGTPRAYFVEVEGQAGRPEALCVVPRHLEEGREVEVPRTFALKLDRPVRFELRATTRARFEQPGDLAPVDEQMAPLPPIETVLRSASGKGGEVPVRLHAGLTEIGTLELWCVATDRDARWKLEFSLRGQGAAEAPSEVAEMPRRFGEAKALVELFYGKKPADVEKREVKGLFRALEKVLGPREGWTTPVIRELWAALHAGRARRRRTADHERLWLQLAGWCLRPGFGAPLDAWRVAETFQVFPEGLQFQAEPNQWQAWWVLWRRVAGGLDAAQQERIFELIGAFLPPLDPKKPKPKKAGVKPEAVDELIRLAGALERLQPARKVQAGEALFQRARAEGAAPHLLWALGRLGARVPFYGSPHACVSPETAEDWITRLLALKAAPADLAFPLLQLARRSGDRAREVSDDVRARVLSALAEVVPAESLRPVREVVALAGADEQRIFGESLPKGLRLVAEPEVA
ncbi:Hsp70 family protein [Anaeromyxobacter paludicola]|uniref:Heat-shock protein n=1 Tax=Anaeromyxobacter paludicola TaxID=2918171 RepID=A0ABN6NBP5_9BACT|nr:Hsp70 family protein [Anaeromyxobacter paludicola]BDG10674.1 heat-shock protein [Anaeromyxobacter paludicola]